MPGYSKIEWTERTWNPVTGCTKVSSGCAHCYAERLALRLQKMGNPRYKNGFNVKLHYDLIEVPLKWMKPSVIFVNSMSDLFHEEIPLEFIKRVFEVMAQANWHIFQILTKRSERLKKLAHKLEWSPNIWMGVSVENHRYVYRIRHLISTPAKIKFVSFEPLLGPVGQLPFLKDIDWVIVGGESGPYARPMKKEWVEEIYEQCKKFKIPFFFKQWGGVQKWKTGRKLNGKEYNEMPIKQTLSLF